jgi:hypothetical protein
MPHKLKTVLPQVFQQLLLRCAEGAGRGGAGPSCKHMTFTMTSTFSALQGDALHETRTVTWLHNIVAPRL